jgi:hypothetical protein
VQWHQGVRLLCIELALSLVASLGVAAVVANPALATTCSPGPSSHCYALVDSYPSGLYGAVMALDSSALQVANPGQCNDQFIDNEMWLFTNSGHWVEQGEIEGAQCNNNTVYHFWADKRPGDTQINYHQDEGDSLNHAFGNYIWYAGNNTYELLWYDATAGGQLVYSYSINNTAVPPDAGINGGTEYGQNPANGGINTTDFNLAYYNGSSWVSGWPGAYVGAGESPICMSYQGNVNQLDAYAC